MNFNTAYTNEKCNVSVYRCIRLNIIVVYKDKCLFFYPNCTKHITIKLKNVCLGRPNKAINSHEKYSAQCYQQKQ